MNQDEDRRAAISARVKEHYDYLIAAGYEVMFTALQGSQNYGLDEYSDEYMSDIDTKSIILPNVNDFVSAAAPVSTVEVLDNEEHAEVKDIRIMFEMFKKENISYIELLYSKFIVVNPKYQDFVNELLGARDRISAANKIQFVKCIAGMAYEKRKALCHPYPGIIEKIEKYGYDGKQAHHCARLLEFISRYEAGEPVSACYESKKRNELMPLKKQKWVNGKLLPLEDAILLCDNAVKDIKKIRDKIEVDLNDRGYEPDVEAYKFLDKLKERVLKFKIREDILKEDAGF